MKVCIEKLTLDEKVGRLHDLTTAEVSAITSAFFHELAKHIVEGTEVNINGFGIFKMVVRRGVRQSHITLNRSDNFNGNTVGTTVVDVKKKYYVCFRRSKVFTKKFHERYGKQKVVKDGQVRSGRIGK